MKSVSNINKILVVVILIIGYSCSSDNEDDIAPPPPPPMGEKLTYTANIKSIIDSNCIGCHANPPVNGAPFPLIIFQNVSSKASAILNAVSKQTGESAAMPPSGRLAQGTIDSIDQWIKDGLLE